MFVPAFPTLALRDLGRSRAWPYQQIPQDAALFFRGAGAIVHASRMLRLSSEDEVLVPAYHCGVEVEAVRHTGARIRFVPIRPDLHIDADEIRASVVQRTRAILVIHYFGFPQRMIELRGLCDELGLVLIEDCAHALFSRAGSTWLGSDGDFSVFSFQKTLPVPDGGALVSRRGQIDLPEPASPSLLTTARGVSHLLLARARSHAGVWEPLLRNLVLGPARGVARLARGWAGPQGIISPSAAELDPATATLGMSDAARRIASNADARGIVAARRDHYATLTAALENTTGIEIPMPRLDDGACPLFLPLLVKERDALRAWLTSKGIETFVFGEIPHPLLPAETCPVANRWSRENLCLPVHQDLTSRMVSAIQAAVVEWNPLAVQLETGRPSTDS